MISGLFPALAFRIDYDEPGLNFAGTAAFRAGHGGGGHGGSRFNQMKEEGDEEEGDEDTNEYGDTGDGDIVFTFTTCDAGSLITEAGLGEAVDEVLAVLMSHWQGPAQPHLRQMLEAEPAGFFPSPRIAGG